ncbi:hypothetical protein NDU88_002595 [Pleurodeles waltl]|uniref:Uncharacterized protein n=1 Tax=Pleurodeles waltl TaxID=8319 RepID=A0AAV7TM31_PLEWA|nr:hypothetical protein NDU88_002595 [Pleurodeles waltl]
MNRAKVRAAEELGAVPMQHTQRGVADTEAARSILCCRSTTGGAALRVNISARGSAGNNCRGVPPSVPGTGGGGCGGGPRARGGPRRRRASLSVPFPPAPPPGFGRETDSFGPAFTEGEDGTRQRGQERTGPKPLRGPQRM